MNIHRCLWLAAVVKEGMCFANFVGASGLSAYVECMETSTPKTVFNRNFNGLAGPLNILRFEYKFGFGVFSSNVTK